MIRGIIHAGLSTRNMEASIHFYGEVLGGRVIMEIEEPKGEPFIVCFQYKDGTCVELFYPRQEHPLGEQLGRNHLCFGVDNIEAISKRLMDYGVEIEVHPQRARDGNYQMWCLDPNGYRVEFIEYQPDSPQLVTGPKKVFF